MKNMTMSDEALRLLALMARTPGSVACIAGVSGRLAGVFRHGNVVETFPTTQLDAMCRTGYLTEGGRRGHHKLRWKEWAEHVKKAQEAAAASCRVACETLG